MARNRRWTAEEDAILRRTAKIRGLYWRDAAVEVGRSDLAVRLRAMRLGLTVTHPAVERRKTAARAGE